MSARPNFADVIRDALRAAAWTVRSRSYIDLSADLDDTVLLAGSGRSGTTWVQELVDRSGDYRIIFEPLTPDRVPSVAHFRSLQYLRNGEHDQAYLDPIESILRGRLRNPWADHHNRVTIARRRLVKEIRANLMLGALHENFPELRIVWLVRHPCAVAESALRMGWQDHLDDLLAQPDLVSDHLEPMVGWLSDLHDPFQRRIAQWSIEQLIPFRQLAPGQVHLVFYEDLVRHPAEEGGRLLSYLGDEWDAAAEDIVRRPSRLARPDGTSRADDPATGWRTRVSPGDLRSAREILDAMGLGRLYGEDGLPDRGSVPALSLRS